MFPNVPDQLHSFRYPSWMKRFVFRTLTSFIYISSQVQWNNSRASVNFIPFFFSKQKLFCGPKDIQQDRKWEKYIVVRQRLTHIKRKRINTHESHHKAHQRASKEGMWQLWHNSICQSCLSRRMKGLGLIATGQMDGKKKGCLGGVFHFILKVADR